MAGQLFLSWWDAHRRRGLLIKGARSLPGTSLAALQESHPYPYGGLLGSSGVNEAEALDLMLHYWLA
jgi:hypothetical protein